MQILALSAHTPLALTETARRLREYLAGHPQIALDDLCAAVTGRSALAPSRLALIAASQAELYEQLTAFVAGEHRAGQFTGQVIGTSRPRVAFLLTGQGSQYPNMGRQLYATVPVFKDALDRCAELVNPYLQQPLLSVMYPAGDRPTPLHDTAYTQPALFALEYALAQVWRSWGIEPDAMIGHSVGEYIAACLSDVFSLEDGLRLIALRGRLMQELPANGSMAVIFANEARVRTALEPFQQTVSISGINGPSNIVISGLRETVDALLASFQSEGILTFRLTVSHAFHSPLIEPMLAPFEQAARRICYQRPRVPIVSNLTGALLAGLMPDAAYWRRHARGSVRFADGMHSLCAHGCRVFLELGPDPVLIGMGKRCASTRGLVWLAAVEKSVDNRQTMLTSLATLFVHGAPVRWPAVYGHDGQSPLPLPADLIEPVLS